MIKKLDGTRVNKAVLTQQINKTIKSSVRGYQGETFGDVVVRGIADRQSAKKELRPSDLKFRIRTAKGVREPTARRRVEVWALLVTEGIADRQHDYVWIDHEKGCGVMG